ncbi:MAG: nitrogen regulation protein NR(II) [Nitrospiria bacterium]
MSDSVQGLIQQLKTKEAALEQVKRDAEDRANRIESYNENILQSVPSGVLTYNKEKIITTFNHAAGEILSLSAESVLMRSYLDVFKKSEKMIRMLDETLEKEKALLRLECEVERVDGKKVWLGLNISLLYDKNRKMIGATLVFTDLSEKKMLEEQLSLKKRLEMMGEMSAWIAHEFRNYMSTILGFSRLLEKKLDGEEDPRKGMIKAITNELSAMEQLITALLSYGKKMVIHPKPVTISSLLHPLITQFSENPIYKKINWFVTLEAPIPQMNLDPVLMRQAFSNLIQNAIEAMPDGGELEVRAYMSPAGRGQVNISDDGTGIPEGAASKIFLPFFTTKEQGTGLGLALVHKVILSHNGHISFESSKEQGTTFTVSLPLEKTDVIPESI